MVDQLKYLKIAALSEFPENERLFLEINDLPIVIYSLNGEYFATGDVCTHDGGSIGEGQIEGNEVICPRHGARFDIKTGKVTRFPAVEDIPSYPVKIEDGYLYLGLPE
jgi:3-phenylpropionate/trans-cinnamate dioxygenase ferredoxin subunit